MFHLDEEVVGMGTTRDLRTTGPHGHVRLVYRYTDGHVFTTETMLRDEALAYMPLLHAVAVDAENYEAPFARIELRTA